MFHPLGETRLRAPHTAEHFTYPLWEASKRSEKQERRSTRHTSTRGVWLGLCAILVGRVVQKCFGADHLIRQLTTDDRVKLHYEEIGTGTPLIFVHEFAGDCRSWEQQVRYFSRRYRVVTWNYRGYPPSEVPKDGSAYSVEILVEDLRALMQHLGIRRAHIGGLSLGGGVTVNFGIRHPEA